VRASSASATAMRASSESATAVRRSVLGCPLRRPLSHCFSCQLLEVCVGVAVSRGEVVGAAARP
jgi:hypothetical protein